MGSSVAITGSLLWLLTVGQFVIRQVSSDVCKVEVPDRIVYQIQGLFGGTLTLNAEVTDGTFLRQWYRTPTSNNGQGRTELLVTHNGTLVWADPSNENYYKASYTKEAANKPFSFKFEFKKMTCNDRGEFYCNFQTVRGECRTTYNVNITADPLPPVLKNQTVQASDGEEVTVLCEANVGYPAGDIAWYYVPTDGGILQRLTTQTDEITSAGDCRTYSKSKLVYTVRKQDHLSKFRCIARNHQQQYKEYVDVGILITGQALPTAAPPDPCSVNCTDAVKDGGGRASQTSVSILVVLLSTFMMAFVSSILHT